MHSEKAKQVKFFYDNLKFPGNYTLSQLENYRYPIENQFLAFLENNLTNAKNVLDLGCGTGLVTNLFALRNKSINFTGIDFSTSIDFAKKFSKSHSIKNIHFEKCDILSYKANKKFDIVLCQGVLHHIPDIDNAVENIKKLVSDDGKIILGLYHPMGKFLKKIIKINYDNNMLYKDQELHPYETAFTKRSVKKLFKNYTVTSTYPKKFASLHGLLHSKNGGLCIYTLQKNPIHKKIKNSTF